MQDLPFTLADSWSAIQPLIVVITAVRYNWQKNCASKAVGSGNSPTNRTRWYCAIALNANTAHEMQDIDRLLEVLHGNG